MGSTVHFWKLNNFSKRICLDYRAAPKKTKENLDSRRQKDGEKRAAVHAGTLTHGGKIHASSFKVMDS